MTVRAVEWKKPYTWGIAIEITEDKVINLRLRDENNLIQYDEWDNEIYVDLQLDDEIEPTDELPVWITTGRIIVDNQRDYTGTILVAKTTSGDLIKLVYADDWKVYIDNWTWTFKQIYLKADVDTIINALRVEIKNYVDAHDTVVSSTAPTEPYEGQLWYDTANDVLKTYDGTNWNTSGGGEWNTKTFYLSSTSDLTNAQAAYDWYAAGKNPIIIYNNKTYILSRLVSNYLYFYSAHNTTIDDNSKSVDNVYIISLTLSSSTVTAITESTYWWSWWYLKTWYNYPTPYTPQYDWSPATKKYVDDNVVQKSATAPSSPVEWMLWYDTTNDVLKTYDWTQWNAVSGWSSSVAWGQITGTLSDQTDLQGALDAKQDVLTAWNWITISSANRTRSASTISISIDPVVVATQSEMADKQDVLTAWDNITIEQVWLFESDMKWPCPSGFHVPTKVEWTNIANVLKTTLGLSASTARKHVKMPLAGRRQSNYGTTTSQGTSCSYWTSENYDWSQAYVFYVDDFATWYVSDRASGCPIRALKNTAVAPTSSWTTIYDGSAVAAWAWIFHNATDWLISISWNWTTWYTIADKNVWATVVWNNWDSLTEANCWKYFQWWNNYGFPWTWTLTDKSSTQVDASTYWPWNYYESSTFITRSGSPYRWDNPSNNNLWWWVSQWTWSDWYDTVISSDWPTYEAGNNLAIWDFPLYNHIEESQAMWPCDSGFKLPTSAEWANLINAWITLGAWTASGATNFITYLHIPACQRIKYDWTLDSASYYWTCEQYSTNFQAYNLDLLNMNAADFSAKTNAFPIRAFAKTPVTPTSSWTTVYAGTGWAWIFYNSIDGIISISADGTDWITIQDKNVGATTVYNYWDTMSENNCWKLFQWGNNYWFPYAWVSSTSTSTVDASWYWPGNYFSWSTFIAINGNWDSSVNANLWGWVSWWTMIIDIPTWETGPTIYAKVAVQAYRPSYPTIGMLWYKTDVSTLFVYDWTNWRSI